MIHSNFSLSSIKKLKKELYQLAYTDSLTKVYNRNMLEEFRKILDTMELFVTIIDIDHLKHINDTRGHNEGDILIRSIANQLLCYSSWVFRLGGDEFLMLNNMPKLITSIKDISCGVMYKPICMSLSDAMRDADWFMYENKRKKRLQR